MPVILQILVIDVTRPRYLELGALDYAFDELAMFPFPSCLTMYFSCRTSQDILVIKPPKKSPLLLRTAVLIFSVFCGIFICSVCLKQITSHARAKFLDIHVVETPSQHIVKPTDIPYLHYPKPISFSRDECARNPVQYFVILSNQRSGSGWFETLLNSHVNVSSNGEIFSVYDRRKNISSIVQTLDEVYNLDWLSSASKNECSAAVGLKWMLNQVQKRSVMILWLGS
ncbi:hypothetical protein QN277_027862 [Acacia crassicarpa]|uniref:Sulfotransferase n=1 Tax=Acacia crassicarpa TaxID=499986 RepID=A0AAE1J228_9FABA|nr:hypothetical protein QN277_027862 [Acacia crassicarpa]